MEKELLKLLHLQQEPIGIFLGNTSAVCDLDASPEKRNCVIPLLLAASKGKIISMNEESCNCPGGATGCCFGDGFSRLNPNIHKMLSQGFGDKASPQMPEQMKNGERFFCSEELALKWRNAIPYSEKGYPRILFAPVSKWNEVGTPDIVLLFVKPDHLSPWSLCSARIMVKRLIPLLLSDQLVNLLYMQLIKLIKRIRRQLWDYLIFLNGINLCRITYL